MSKILIGIHGLKNKPPKQILKKWWRWSIEDGLAAIGRPNDFFRFELVYWADLIYPKPFQPSVRDPENPLYLEDPYLPPEKITYANNASFRKHLLHLVENQMDKIFFNDDMSLNFEDVTDMIMRRFFRELDIYYSKTIPDRKGTERPARDVLRDELARVLLKHRHKQIMLIGHSMGSIIAYDVLQHVVPDVAIDTFVTMGSPLGLPVIIHKALLEQYPEPGQLTQPLRLKTPENVQRYWYNIADLSDRVALNFDLADDYDANSNGVQVIDIQVHNDYTLHSERQPHKIYGYLRTPEFAHLVDDFLESRFAIWFSKAWHFFVGYRIKQTANKGSN